MIGCLRESIQGKPDDEVLIDEHTPHFSNPILVH